MKIIKNTIEVLSVFVLAVLFINSSTSDGVFLNAKDKNGHGRDYNVYALDLPQKADFAGESVPLHQREVRERFDRELLVNVYWQSNGLLLIKRAHKYFPIIEPILKKNNIPDDFKYLSIIESGFLNVTSPSGASGFWQFLKSTGMEYGLEINENVDERYNLEKATQAACDFLNKSKANFGSWTLAAAAYNAGVRGIKNQMEKQKVGNYYDLYLNTETSRYIFRILALKEIMSNPKEYGFNYSPYHLYNRDATREIEIDTTIADLADFAIENGTNYKMLKIYNPWLRQTSLENKDGKTYKIKIPIN